MDRPKEKPSAEEEDQIVNVVGFKREKETAGLDLYQHTIGYLKSIIPLLQPQELPLLEEQIDTVESLYDEKLSRWWEEYFHNFHLRLPNNKPEVTNYRSRSKHRWKESLGDIEGSDMEFSEHYLGKTLEEYYRDIDQSITDSGVSAVDIQSLLNKFSDSPNPLIRIELYKLTLPAFIKLILEGYKRVPDLTI